jgi:acylphosphatase
MVERLVAVVRGSVQGVGFRDFVTREGRRLGLSGTVRNQMDGSVEVISEGERGLLEELLRALWRGPDEADVQRVESRWERAQGLPAGFRIGY